MSFDLAANGRSARDRIAVPDVPLATIVRRSHASSSRTRLAVLAAALVAGSAAITAGTGAGARMASSVQIWLFGGNETIRVTNFSGTLRPMSADVRREIAGATFPVVLPVGLPAGTRMSAIFGSPIGRPRAIVVSYVNAATGMEANFTLVDPSVVEAGRALSTMSAGPHPAVYDWRIGGEVVLATKRHLSPELAARIRTAMAATSPTASVTATDAVLPSVTVLGSPDRVVVAERYRAEAGPNMLIDEAQTRSVPALVRRGLPIRDTRTMRVMHVPYRNGEPDYTKARAWNAQTVAIAPEGVRAIAAVLRSSGGANACRCQVLYGRPTAEAYRVVVIPRSTTAQARIYNVDARTGEVRLNR